VVKTLGREACAKAQAFLRLGLDTANTLILFNFLLQKIQ
jgi:hypothetical protein